MKITARKIVIVNAPMRNIEFSIKIVFVVSPEP